MVTGRLAYRLAHTWMYSVYREVIHFSTCWGCNNNDNACHDQGQTQENKYSASQTRLLVLHVFNFCYAYI